MITFKQYLAEEVIASKRKNMMHLQQMKPLEFLDWVQSMHDEFGGVLKNLEVSLKVDGLGARFGKSKDGEFFFEGSRTGPVFKEKAFSTYAKEKGSKQEIIDRAAHYDDIFDILKASAAVKAVPANAKVVCEIFYNPMASEADGHVTFVTVKYDKSKLGSKMTIIPITVIDASTGEDHPDKDKILEALFKTSSNEIKIVDAKLKASDIDIRAVTKSVLKFGQREREVIKSLKAADKPEKAALIAAVQKAKDELAEFLLTHKGVEGKDKLGKDIEGLVFSAGDHTVKVTTQEFKDSKKKA